MVLVFIKSLNLGFLVNFKVVWIKVFVVYFGYFIDYMESFLNKVINILRCENKNYISLRYCFGNFKSLLY